jgi:hypothetical protein
VCGRSWSHWQGHLPKGQTLAEARKDKKVRADLLQCIPDDLLMQDAKKGKEVWDSLKARFVGTDRVKEARLQTLKNEFDAMRMEEDEPLDQYVRKLTGMSVKYSNLDKTLDNTAMVKKLFDTVPERFINIVAGIE